MHHHGSSRSHGFVSSRLYEDDARGRNTHGNVHRNRPAWSRRQQQLRADTRSMARILSGLTQLQQHRGSQLSKMGMHMKAALDATMSNERSDYHGGNTSGRHGQTTSGRHGNHHQYTASSSELDGFGGQFSDSGAHAIFYPWVGEHMGVPSALPYQSFPSSRFRLPPPQQAHDIVDNMQCGTNHEGLGVKFDKLQATIESALHDVSDKTTSTASVIQDVEAKTTGVVMSIRNVDTELAQIKLQNAETVHTINQMLQANGAASSRNASDMREFNHTAEKRHELLVQRLDSHDQRSRQFEALLMDGVEQNRQQLEQHGQHLDFVDRKVEELFGPMKASTIMPQVQTIEKTFEVPQVQSEKFKSDSLEQNMDSLLHDKIDQLFGMVGSLLETSVKTPMEVQSRSEPSVRVSDLINRSADTLNSVDDSIQNIDTGLRLTKFTENFAEIQEMLRSISK